MIKKVTRLYDSFKPQHYKLNLKLDPSNNAFSGTVIITGKKSGRPSKRLTFHQKDLHIIATKVTKHEKKEDLDIQIDRINKHKAYDEVRLHSPTMIYPGEYTIQIEFTGHITNPMNGLYPCYFNHNQKDKQLLATQFESHHAREVFPCIDEPEAKATFDLTLVTPDDDTTVLANTPIISEKVLEKGIWKQTSFETTPIMSTYLLAFVQGEIAHKQAETKNGTLVRAFATPDNVQFVDFALDVAVKCLDFYEEYFDIPFPLPKSDMVALPDFASGAMENWGLVTYREQCMLVDPKNTSLGTKQYVAMVVAHELAHQWFGNLVTMKWWTDLWLNEGFASWIEYLAVDHLFPDWDMWTQFIADEQQSALKLDALDNTHAIEAPINHPDEIRSIFDAISYNKGASVIHMLYGYLGAEYFKKGLRLYLKQHAYKNTSTLDLWSALEEVSKKPVREFMHAWTSQPGFPLLSVENTSNGLKIAQERFYMQKPTKINNKTWPIPLLSHLDNPERLDSTHLDINKVQISKFNKGQSGFYRTLYQPEMLSALTETITDYEPLDRLGLLADSFETAKAGYGSTTDSLELLFRYKDEDNSAVWDIIATNIGEIRRVMDDDSIREAFKPHILKLTKKQLQRLGNKERKSDTHFDKLLRPTILGLASSADHPEIKQWCIETFNKTDKAEEIHADLRGIIFNTAARFGDAKTYQKLLKFHNSTELSEERTTLAAALTAFEQPELIKRSLDQIATKTVRRQDAMYWVAYSFMNRHAKSATWQWMKDNWQWLDSELGSDLSFYRTPIYVARSFSNKDFIKEYNQFFKDKKSPALDRSIKQGLEILEWQTAWRKRDLGPIQQLLN